MNRIEALLRRLFSVGRRRELDRELDEEMGFHLDMKVQGAHRDGYTGRGGSVCGST